MPRVAAKTTAKKAVKAVKEKDTREKDILKLLDAPDAPPAAGAPRIGIHTSTAGGLELACDRAWLMGCNTLQIFTASPRQWRSGPISPELGAEMKSRLKKYGLAPLVSHSIYLINMAAANEEVYANSIAAFRGEIERAIALGCSSLVLHPGSFKEQTREQGQARAVEGLKRAADGVDLAGAGLTVLIENTAGAEFSLGTGYDHVAELIAMLKPHMPTAACIDTCHSFASGYDLASVDGYDKTLALIDSTVGLKDVHVWHCNDAKAELGSKLDRHEQIGVGTMGAEPFRRLLNDPRLRHSAFIAETPIDAPLDDLNNVRALKALCE